MMKKTILVSCFVVSAGFCLAETSTGSGSSPTPVPVPTPAMGNPSSGGAYPNNLNQGLIRTLDPDFFSASGQSAGPVPPATSPKGREFDDMPDYTTDQRDAWLRKCGAYKDQDSKLFRECFQKEREKMRLELREKFDAVERRQGGGKTPYDNLLQPQKSSGGFD